MENDKLTVNDFDTYSTTSCNKCFFNPNKKDNQKNSCTNINNAEIQFQLYKKFGSCLTVRHCFILKKSANEKTK